MAGFARLVVVVLALVVSASPIAACVAAASQMTQAESDCCEQMAGECGSGMDMPASHSCCKEASVQRDEAVLGKAGHPFALELFAAVEIGVPIAPSIEEHASTSLSDIHGPPGISSKTLQALRI